MSDAPAPFSPGPASTPEITLESLAAAQRSLRAAFQVSLVLLFILSASLSVFFLREVSIARRQITELSQGVTEYEKNAVPWMEDFRARLQAFARMHADFAPIYLKYFGTNVAPLGVTPGRAQPAGSGPVRMPPPGSK